MGNGPVTITVVYDNRSQQKDLTPDWGFACVVDAAGHRLLFDTGAKGELLLANMKMLGIDPTTVEAVVISHNHWDHTGGLESVLPLCSARCYVPASAATELGARAKQTGGTSIPVTGRAAIWPGVWLTGELGEAIREQSLVVETDSGLVLVTGCAHPGVVNIARRVKEDFGRPPHLVLGGFHLGHASPEEVKRIVGELRTLGVAKAGPCHCTGDEAIGQFQQNWPDGFEQIGCGRVLKLEAK
ncbi:MAG: MBL fold metallo-hydrolase [candidate division WOR-3 bacterium]|nr:MBL fold metallo-hydrolase [candidate division WOR-3 bacterium]